MTEESNVLPWYRQPWFWFLLIFPGMSIIWCTVAISVALSSDNDMVTDDYSKEGRGINAELARDTRAAELGFHATLSFSGERLELELENTSGEPDFPYLILNLFHPTLADRDRTIQLQPVSGNRYSAALPKGMDGRWYLDLRGPENQWRLKGEISLPSTRPLDLNPGIIGQG